MEMIKRFFKEEDGATVVEYALMVALIAVAVAATVLFLGEQVDEKFKEVVRCIRDGSCGESDA